MVNPEENAVTRSIRGAVPLRGLLAVTAVALIPVIAGCEAGTNAPTQQWHQAAPGAYAVVANTIRINNMFVLGPPPASVLPAGSSAGVFLALSNGGAADKLISISAPGAAAAVRLPGGEISLGSQQTVRLTGPAPQVVLDQLTRAVHGGQTIKMVLDFQNAGTKTLQVPVLPRAAYFSTYSPAPVSASPSPTSSHRQGHHKKGQATPSPTPT